MRIRLLLGPAGSGKTYRCLAEARRALAASPEGRPLVFLAPKQATYQLERQLLADPSVPGFTRLHILSFERLAHLIFDRLGKASPKMLDEEGRLMVLRGLLAKNRERLRLFRASARLTGFACQLSRLLSELQRNQLTPAALEDLSGRVQGAQGLALKLQDLSSLLRDYLGWLQARNLQDADCLLAAAAETLARHRGIENSSSVQPTIEANAASSKRPEEGFRIARLWVDGFAEFSEQELELLVNLVPHCEQATLAFCVDGVPSSKHSWMSPWSTVHRSFERCRSRLAAVPGTEVHVELLRRQPDRNRFQGNPVLNHLEVHWADLEPYSSKAQPPGEGRVGEQLLLLPDRPGTPQPKESLRIAICADPEVEATLAAGEILRHVRTGGRFREVSVTVRSLTDYHQVLARVFSRYEIPFFLDRRESVSHHPLAELTRSALRTVAFQWQHDDWFSALKTGLVPAEDNQIDRLENEALSRGWRGAVWQQPIVVPDDPNATAVMGRLVSRLLPPFQRLALAMQGCRNQPTGPLLAKALQGFWQDFDIESQLDRWAEAQVSTAESSLPGSVHGTVWEQMNAWLANVELAFPTEALPLREWLPILDAGLANLSVGVIPPALDQVLIGAIDRSRNPDIKLAILAGMNEMVFPAKLETVPLLNDADRSALERFQVMIGLNTRQQIGRERYLAYIACTRARQRLVLTCAQQDAQGTSLNPSPFLNQVHQMFPSLDLEIVTRDHDWRNSEHASELSGTVVSALAMSDRSGVVDSSSSALLRLPKVASILEQLRQVRPPPPNEALSSELAGRLYGQTLHTSVSRLEQFAACPFRFFVHSGLKAEERKLFELDTKEQGSFQHDVLALFHEQLRAEGKHWRDLTAAQARVRVEQAAHSLMASYRQGLLEATEEARFKARVLTGSLQDFVETLVGWMREQYQFEPAKVELPFGHDGGFPPWTIDLDHNRKLALRGRIDRVDLFRTPHKSAALCVVVDYKSGRKQLEPLLVTHGIQLQLLAYLNVLRHWSDPQSLFGVEGLIPAGVFYVSLHGKYETQRNRLDALAGVEEARKLAYRHTGRFDKSALHHLDARPDVKEGDQFNFRINNNGGVSRNSREALSTGQFVAMLNNVELRLREMGNEIFLGLAAVSPFRKGAVTACDNCSYRPICRLDPWTHPFRVLRKSEPESTTAAVGAG